MSRTPNIVIADKDNILIQNFENKESLKSFGKFLEEYTTAALKTSGKELAKAGAECRGFHSYIRDRRDLLFLTDTSLQPGLPEGETPARFGIRSGTDSEIVFIDENLFRRSTTMERLRDLKALGKTLKAIQRKEAGVLPSVEECRDIVLKIQKIVPLDLIVTGTGVSLEICLTDFFVTPVGNDAYNAVGQVVQNLNDTVLRFICWVFPHRESGVPATFSIHEQIANYLMRICPFQNVFDNTTDELLLILGSSAEQMHRSKMEIDQFFELSLTFGLMCLSSGMEEPKKLGYMPDQILDIVSGFTFRYLSAVTNICAFGSNDMETVGTRVQPAIYNGIAQ